MRALLEQVRAGSMDVDAALERLGPQRRVAVTGVGLVTSVGIGTETVWEAIKCGKNGIEPITNSAATMKPHSAMVTGLAATTRIEVSSATAAPTSRSSSNGNEIAPMASTTTANRKPTPVPTTIKIQPAGVLNTSLANWLIEAGGV